MNLSVSSQPIIGKRRKSERYLRAASLYSCRVKENFPAIGMSFKFWGYEVIRLLWQTVIEFTGRFASIDELFVSCGFVVLMLLVIYDGGG